MQPKGIGARDERGEPNDEGGRRKTSLGALCLCPCGIGSSCADARRPAAAQRSSERWGRGVRGVRALRALVPRPRPSSFAPRSETAKACQRAVAFFADPTHRSLASSGPGEGIAQSLADASWCLSCSALTPPPRQTVPQRTPQAVCLRADRGSGGRGVACTQCSAGPSRWVPSSWANGFRRGLTRSGLQTQVVGRRHRRNARDSSRTPTRHASERASERGGQPHCRSHRSQMPAAAARALRLQADATSWNTNSEPAGGASEGAAAGKFEIAGRHSAVIGRRSRNLRVRVRGSADAVPGGLPSALGDKQRT